MNKKKMYYYYGRDLQPGDIYIYCCHDDNHVATYFIVSIVQVKVKVKDNPSPDNPSPDNISVTFIETKSGTGPSSSSSLRSLTFSRMTAFIHDAVRIR